MSSRNTLWELLQHHAETNNFTTKDSFTKIITHEGISYDYSGQHVNREILDLLYALAEQSSLPQKIKSLFNGGIVNLSEQKPALHTALRSTENDCIIVQGENIVPQIHNTLREIENIVYKIRNKQWHGGTGKPIKNIINIGIGGSDLGPRFCLNALKSYATEDLNFYFIQDADPKRFENTVKTLEPEETLFIVSSKSFSTIETLYNAKKAIAWVGPKNVKNQFIAVTEHAERALKLGIHHILPLWSWIGGRYSFCSAINLISAIALGMEYFNAILAGARSMDEHFAHSSWDNNLPILLGLIGIWNNNFLNINTLLLLTYAEELEQLVSYVQQLEMESNGKSVDCEGKKVEYSTVPIIWGGSGNHAEHSYYQLLCQGTHKLTVDLFSIKKYDSELLNKSCFAKKNLFLQGNPNLNNPNAHIEGNIPFNHITLDICSPYTIGSLTALFEHKVFIQSVIWKINPFDQPGVESAKRFKQ